MSDSSNFAVFEHDLHFGEVYRSCGTDSITPSFEQRFFLRRLSRGDEGRSAIIFQAVFCEKAGQISWKSCEHTNPHSQTPKDL